MNNTCTCGIKFMDAEDWRDHMPCPGNDKEKLAQKCKEVEELKARVAELESIKYKMYSLAISDYPSKNNCPTCGSYDCGGAPRFKGICPHAI